MIRSFSFMTLSLLPLIGGLPSIEITAETVDWNKETRDLISLDTVQMHSPSIGTFTSSEKWTLKKEEGTFLAIGSTTFTGVDGLQLTCNGSLEYDPKTERIRARGESAPLFIEKDGLFFTAHSGEIGYNDSQIETFTFSDSAKVQINDVAALLEEIRFDKSSNSFVFLSKDGVVTLSHGETTIPIHVEKLQISKDLTSSTPSIKGLGRVHFSFDETHIDQLLDSVNQCIKSLY